MALDLWRKKFDNGFPPPYRSSRTLTTGNIQRNIPREMKTPRFVLAFFLIALALRLSVLTWGAGLGEFERRYHPDEDKTLTGAVNFPGNYATHGGFLYGTTVQYGIGALLLPVKAWWKLVGPITDRITYSQLVLLIYRALNCLLGAMCVLLGYRLALRISDRLTAAITAGLVAVSFYHCLNSALTTLDVTMSFVALAALILSIRAFRSMRLVDFIWLGLVSGALLGTKISGGIFALTPITLAVFALIHLRKEPDCRHSGDSPDAGRRGRLLLGLLLCPVIAFVVFVVSSPHIFLWPLDYLRSMQYQQFMWMDRAEHSLTSIIVAWTRGFAVSLTPVVLVLSVAGMVHSLTRPPRMDPQVSLAILAFLAGSVVFWRGYVQPRFLIVFTPVMCFYAALSVATMVRSRSRLICMLGGVALSIAAGHSLYICCMGIASRYSDTRTDAARYISKKLPEGSRIAFASTSPDLDWSVHAWRYPVIDEDRFEIVGLFDQPDFIIIEGYSYSEMRDALSSGLLDDEYRWPDSEAARWYHREIPPPATFRLFDEIFRNRGPYAEVESWSVRTTVPIEFPPPDIRLYRHTPPPISPRSG
jgi:hypothetical protein